MDWFLYDSTFCHERVNALLLARIEIHFYRTARVEIIFLFRLDIDVNDTLNYRMNYLLRTKCRKKATP